jgi:hypothetical protein
MYRFTILLALLSIQLASCRNEFTREVSPANIQIETNTYETPEETKIPPSPSTQEKATKVSPTLESVSPTNIEIDQAYLTAFHACDSFNLDCRDPRNHRVYLAGSDYASSWYLIQGWVPFQGSVPDVIRRGDTLYVYTGVWLVRYHFDTGGLDEPVPVEISPGEGWIQTHLSCKPMFL